MIPLLGIVADLFPQIAKQLGGPLQDQSASLQDQVVEAIKKATNIPDPRTADAQVVQIAIKTIQPSVKDQLQKDLQDIALAELKERDRANEEAQRVELERYRMDAEERERLREQQFQQQLLDFQDRQVARSTQMQLAEEHSPLAWVAPILAFILVGMIWYLLHAILTAREQVINRDVFNVVLGALVTAFTTVMAYYFGSSLGSSRKDDALHNGRLVTNPKMREQDDPGDDEASESAPAPSSTPGKSSGSATRTSKPAPAPTGLYGLFRQKAPAIMRDLMRDLGLSETQAAGILGNIGWECGGFKQLQEQNPVMGGRGGLGWCQWTASRRAEFERWLAENGFNYQNDAANYGFLLNELRGSQAASVRAIRQAPNLEAATNEFMRVFERPAARYAHLEDRVGLAKLALQEYGRAFNVS
jgi:Phage tail lysozyme